RQVRRRAGAAAAPERQPRRQRDRRVALPGQRRGGGGPGGAGAGGGGGGLMPGRSRLANDAWEALLTAHAEIMRRLAEEDVWCEVSMREYDVLYTLSKCREPIRLGELNRRVLLS